MPPDALISAQNAPKCCRGSSQHYEKPYLNLRGPTYKEKGGGMRPILYAVLGGE